jgi:Tol biopolymer transport system component
VAAADGSGEALIARGEQPAVSPKGNLIAFVRGKDVFTARADGGKARNLTGRYRKQGPNKSAGFLAPSFSPDGGTIVLNSNFAAPAKDRFNDDIFVIRTNGDSFVRLTEEGIEEYGATFSPDGKQIAFVGETERGAKKDGIYVMRANGTRPRVVLKTKRPGPPSWQPLPQAQG